MRSYDIVNIIYLFVLSCAAISSINRFKSVDFASKIIAILMCCAFVNESAAFYLAKKYHNNLLLYSIYSLVEFFVTCLYFNAAIDVFKRRHIGIYIGILGAIFGVINLLVIQKNSFNSYFLLLEGLMINGMCLFAFFRLLLKREWLNLSKFPHFWFTSIFMFFWSITFLSWGLYDYINEQLLRSAEKVNTALLIISSITYACFGIVFLLYPKLKTSNE